jgi:hypothetical protein
VRLEAYRQPSDRRVPWGIFRASIEDDMLTLETGFRDLPR